MCYSLGKVGGINACFSFSNFPLYTQLIRSFFACFPLCSLSVKDVWHPRKCLISADFVFDFNLILQYHANFSRDFCHGVSYWWVEELNLQSRENVKIKFSIAKMREQRFCSDISYYITTTWLEVQTNKFPHLENSKIQCWK